MDNDWDKRIHVDQNGKRWLTDDEGKLLKDEFGDNIPPSQSQVNSKENEFTTYDTSQGHCALCGRLTCNGGCFK